MTTTHVFDADRAALAPLHRHEQALALLTGQHGPLVVSPFDPDVAALAYLIFVAYRRAGRPGICSPAGPSTRPPRRC